MRELHAVLEAAYNERRSLALEINSAKRENMFASDRFQKWDRGLLLKRRFKKAFGQRRTAAEESAALLAELEEQLSLSKVPTGIELSETQVEFYNRLRDDFSALAQCASIWDTTSARATHQVRERTVANRAIVRRPVEFMFRDCDLIEWGATVPHLGNANGGDIFLYPGVVLYRAGPSSFSVIDAREVEICSEHVRFVEEDPLPTDCQTEGYTWFKANRDGSPDRRFANNYQIPIALYGKATLRSTGGLNEEYMFSNPRLIDRFAESWEKFRQALRSTEM